MARRCSWLSVGVVGLLAVAASPAAGSTFIGSDLNQTPLAQFTSTPRITLVQTAAPATGGAADGWVTASDGIVVSWSVRSAIGSTATARIRIVRPGLSGTATGAGTGVEAHALTFGISSFDERLPIQDGDGIGIDIEGGAAGVLANPGDGAYRAWNPALTDGEAPRAGGSPVAGMALLVQAVIELDADTDGFGDETQDNCRTLSNPSQADLDGDGNGDACDPDDDGDGVPDSSDNCAALANPNQANTDGGGSGDACDADDDNDAVPDTSDNCRLVLNRDQRDLDGDGAGDGCDVDDDGDSAGDTADNCATVANADQSNIDGDGPGDACDADDDEDGLTDMAETALGTSSADLDSDDDGLADAREDRDLDGRKDRRETNPAKFDTDRDRLGDGLELGRRRGIADPLGEIEGTGEGFRRDRHPRSKTNPLKRDTDGDGVRDGREDRNRNGRVDKGETNPRR